MKRRSLSLLAMPVVPLTLILGSRKAFALSAKLGPGSEGAFMNDGYHLFLDAFLWVAFGVVGMTAFLLIYFLLRLAVRELSSKSRISPENITAFGWVALSLVILAVTYFEMVTYGDEPSYVTVNVTAHEWYWEYNYVSVPGLHFVSHVIPNNQLRPGQVPGGSVDHPLVLPAGKRVHFIVTSADIVHGFVVSPLGLSIYAVPGAMLSGWAFTGKPGRYVGFSSSICGTGHPPMPIEIKVVPLNDYLTWTKRALTTVPGNKPVV